MNNVSEQLEDPIEGLLVPTQEEARYMVDQFPDMDGAPYIIQPLNYDIDLAIERGLATSAGFSDRYLNMQALYRRALEQYLAEKLSLNMFDEMLATNELRFIPVPDERRDFYHRYSTFGFQYIYLRNNLPIERLSVEDLDVLSSYIEMGHSSVTEELLELVARTYHNIIIAFEDQDHDSPIGFSNDGQKTAPNNALVFEIGHTAEFDENGNIVSREDERRRREYLEYEFISLVEQQFSEELGIPVVIFNEKK